MAGEPASLRTGHARRSRASAAAGNVRPGESETSENNSSQQRQEEQCAQESIEHHFFSVINLPTDKREYERYDQHEEGEGATRRMSEYDRPAACSISRLKARIKLTSLERDHDQGREGAGEKFLKKIKNLTQINHSPPQRFEKRSMYALLALLKSSPPTAIEIAGRCFGEGMIDLPFIVEPGYGMVWTKPFARQFPGADAGSVPRKTAIGAGTGKICRLADPSVFIDRCSAPPVPAYSGQSYAEVRGCNPRRGAGVV